MPGPITFEEIAGRAGVHFDSQQFADTPAASAGDDAGRRGRVRLRRGWIPGHLFRERRARCPRW